MKKIVLWPSHDPDQYIRVADKLINSNPDLEISFFLLKKPNLKIPYNFITYESLVESCNLKEDELAYESPLNINEFLLVILFLSS